MSIDNILRNTEPGQKFEKGTGKIRRMTLGSIVLGHILLTSVACGRQDNDTSLYEDPTASKKEHILADGFIFPDKIGDSAKVMDWMKLSKTKNLLGKAVVAWPKTEPQKGKIWISGNFLIYTPFLGQQGEDSFLISILDSFDDPMSEKFIMVKVSGIDTLGKKSIINIPEDTITYSTEMVADWQAVPGMTSEAFLDGRPYKSYGVIPDGNHDLELVTYDPEGEAEKTIRKLNIDTRPVFNLVAEDDSDRFSLDIPKDDSMITLVKPQGEVMIKLEDLNIPAYHISMSLGFSDSEMSKEIREDDVSFDNKSGGFASLKIKLKEGFKAPSHTGHIDLKVINGRTGCSKNIQLKYRVIDEKDFRKK